MSDRNTALLIPGHAPPEALLRLILAAPGVRAEDFAGDEAPRVGHGVRQGRPFTHLALRVFEVGGLLLLDNLALPGPDELECYLGRELSKTYGKAVFILYDEEQAAGGHALFEAGKLAKRLAVDGRWGAPVRREGESEEVLQDLDPSSWVWPGIADAVEAGASPIVGPGVRTDDDIAALIALAAARPVQPAAAPAAPPPAAEPTRKRDRVLGLLRRFSGR